MAKVQLRLSAILTTPYHGYLKLVALSLCNRWDKPFSVDHEGRHIEFFLEELANSDAECVGVDVLGQNVCGHSRSPRS